MTKNRIAYVAVFSLAWGGAKAARQTQTPTFSLKAVKVNDVAIEPTNSVSASPGDVIECEVFVSEWSPNGERLKAWQWGLDSFSLSNGRRERLQILGGPRACLEQEECADLAAECYMGFCYRPPVGGPRPCEEPADCASSEECVAGLCYGSVPGAAGIYLDFLDPRYVFFGLAHISATDTIDLRMGGVLFNETGAPQYDSGESSARYVGTLILVVSAGACDTFVVALEENETSLAALSSAHIRPLQIQPLTVDCGPCRPRFASSEPPHCYANARQTNEPDGSSQAGIDSFTVVFDGDPVITKPSSYYLTYLPTCFCDTLIVEALSVPKLPKAVSVLLSRRIATQRWTCLNVTDGLNQVCVSHLPGDVDQNRVVGLSDMEQLLTCMGDESACPATHCDIDRSGLCTGKDLLRLGDLMNGAGVYPAWLGIRMPPCPTAP
jgi:hypothetical protein